MAAAAWFERGVLAVVLVSATLVGLETSATVTAHYADWLQWANRLVVACFAAEAAIKLIAVAPRFSVYFRNGWNIFDFSILVLSLIPLSSQYVMVARLLRVLRTLRLVSAWPRMRLLVGALIQSIPSIFNILFLFSILAYIYAVMGYFLFSRTDPPHWGSLGSALLSLFKIVTLENWSGLLENVSAAHPYAWLYFVSFIVIGTFVIVNLFIAVVLNSMEENNRLEHDDAEAQSFAGISADIGALRVAVQSLEMQLRSQRDYRGEESAPRLKNHPDENTLLS